MFLLLDTRPLDVGIKNSFVIKTYYMLDGEKIEVAQNNIMIPNSRRVKRRMRFFVDLPTINASPELFFEVNNSADQIHSVYSYQFNFSTAFDNTGNNFGLDYAAEDQNSNLTEDDIDDLLFNKIHFEMVRRRTTKQVQIRKANGKYIVSIPFFRNTGRASSSRARFLVNSINKNLGSVSDSVGDISAGEYFNLSQGNLYLSYGSTSSRVILETDLLATEAKFAQDIEDLKTSLEAQILASTFDPSVLNTAVNTNQARIDTLEQSVISLQAVDTSALDAKLNVLNSKFNLFEDNLDITNGEVGALKDKQELTDIDIQALKDKQMLMKTNMQTLRADLMSGTTTISSKSLDNSKFANNSVDSRVIKDKSLTGADIKDGSIGANKLANNVLTGANIKANTVDGSDIRDKSLTGADIKDGTLTKNDLNNELRNYLKIIDQLQKEVQSLKAQIKNK